jgi:hypothetical protein
MTHFISIFQFQSEVALNTIYSFNGQLQVVIDCTQLNAKINK